MNPMIGKALGLAAVLIVGTLAVVKSMKIDLSDPVNLITMVGAVAIAALSFGVAAKYMSQMKTDKAGGQLAEENWDGIGEYKNELPAGWAYTFLGVFLWSLWYGLLGYPVMSYSQVGEYNKEVQETQRKFADKFKQMNDEDLNNMGKSIYLVQCAPCHGVTGDGNSGQAHDFTHRLSKEQILDVIKNGQNQLGYPMGAMPPGLASGQAAEEVAAWVAGGMKGKAPAAWATCAGCHGQDGAGNNGMAPNLKAYDATLIKHVLEHGKKGMIGVMPAFKGRFIPVQEKALTNYIASIAQE